MVQLLVLPRVQLVNMEYWFVNLVTLVITLKKTQLRVQRVMSGTILKLVQRTAYHVQWDLMLTVQQVHHVYHDLKERILQV